MRSLFLLLAVLVALAALALPARACDYGVAAAQFAAPSVYYQAPLAPLASPYFAPTLPLASVQFAPAYSFAAPAFASGYGAYAAPFQSFGLSTGYSAYAAPSFGRSFNSFGGYGSGAFAPAFGFGAYGSFRGHGLGVQRQRVFFRGQFR